MNDKFMMKVMVTLSGMVFVIMGIYGITRAHTKDDKDTLFIKNAETCYAYVDYVDEYTIGEIRGKTYVDVQYYDAYVHYSVDGQSFRNVEIPGTTPRAQGDVIEIYYDPDNPSDFIVKSTLSEQKSTYGKEVVSIVGGVILMFWGILGSFTTGEPLYDKIFFYNNDRDF